MSNEQNRGAPILNLDEIGGVQSTSMLKSEVSSDLGLSALGSRDPQSMGVPQGGASPLHVLDSALANSASAIPDTAIFQQHAVDFADSPEPAGTSSAPHSVLGNAIQSHTDNFVFASVSGSDAVNLNDSFASQDVVHSQFGASAPDDSAPTAGSLLLSEHPLGAHLSNGLAAQNNEVHGGSQTDGGGSSGGDPDGQLWFGGEGDISGTSSGSSDDQIGHIDSDGNGRDVSDVDSGTAAFQAVGIDSAAGLYFAYDSDTTLRDGHITNDTQTGQGSQIDSIAMVYGSGESADEVESLAVDPINHIVFMGLFDQTDENTGIIEVTYNPTTGAMVSPYNASTGTITNFNDMLFDDNSSGDVGASSVAFTNATAMYFDTSTDKLYYIDQTNGYSYNGGSGTDWHSTNGIYEVGVSGSVGTSNAPTPTQLSLNSQFAAGATNNYISGFAVDDAKSMIYFTVSDAGTSTSTLWYMPITGGSATQMTLPGGISIGIAAFFFDGSNPVALDANGQNLYISDGSDSHIVQLSLDSAGTGFNSTGNNNDFMTLDSSNSNTYATALYFDNAPTLDNDSHSLSGTTTEAVQGGSTVTLLTGAAITISDPSSTELGFATVTIANAQSGDVLAATTAGTSITASYNSTTHTLTLSGEDTYAHYEEVMDSVTYQDGGTDSSSGSHPTRTIDWMVSDGTTFADPTASDPNEATTTVTIDRPPTVVTESPSVLEGASATGTSGTGGTGGLDGDSDLDGDTLTITALNGGTLGTPLSGNYGQLTLNANGSYTYNANNTSAINSAAPGSHPVDTFTYTVSDGHGGTTTQTIHISIDRPPTVQTQSETVVEFGTSTGTSGTAGTGALDGDSDPDGDSLTITAVKNASDVSGVLGSSLDGTYGVLVLNANGSYSYTAENSSAINSAATGSHPVDSFTVTVGDGNGGTTTETLNFTIDRLPTVGASGTATFDGGGSAVTLDSGATAADADGDNLTGATVTIASGLLSGDSLNFTTQNGISGSYNSGTGVLTLTGTTSAANYQTALDSITYSFTANNDPTNGGSDTSRTIHWVVTSAAGVSSGTGTSTVDTVHVAPTVTASGTVSYTAGGPAAVLDAGLTLADPDSGGNLTGATISLGEGGITGDTLNFTNQNGISGSYSGGTLTLSGTASIADYQAALESITYTFAPTSGDPTEGGSEPSRTITWTVTDGVDNSGFAAQSTLDVAPDVAPAVSSLTGSATSGADFASGYTATITLDVSKDVTVAGGTTLLLSDGGTATYSSGSGTTTLTFTYDATDAPQALTVSSISAGSIEDSAGKSLPIAGTAVSGYSDAVTDSAANVASNFGSLDSAVSYISSITLNDTGTPNLDLTASEIVNDQTLIGKIVSSYRLIANDTASAIGGAFDSLETYVATISAVIFTDSGTPTLDLTQTQVTNDASLLAKVQGPYDLLVSDVTGHAYTSYQNDYNASDTLTVTTDFNTNGSETIYGYVSGLTLAGTSNADTFYLQSAPDVTVTGGSGNDIFFFGSGFSTSDHVTGGSGSNTLELDGNYTGGHSLTITSSMMSDIQILHLAMGHSYNLTLDAGVITTGQTLTVEAAELVSGNTLTFNASALTGGNLIIDTDGGSFNLTGGPGTNTFNVGGDFTASDEINGGTGTSAVHLDGNYSSGLTFNATTMVNVQTLDLAAGYGYNLTLNNATVGSGTLTINAATLGVGDSLTINGSAVDDGNLVVYAGSGTSFIEGGLGADKLYAGSGADTFAYAAVGDSTGPTFDTIFNFNTNSEKIDLIGSLTGVTAVDTAVTTGILGPANFNTVLEHDIGASQLQAGGAVLFTPSSGGYHGDTFLIIDENGVAGYQAGQDLVIELSHIVSVSSLSVSNFETVG